MINEGGFAGSLDTGLLLRSGAAPDIPFYPVYISPILQNVNKKAATPFGVTAAP